MASRKRKSEEGKGSGKKTKAIADTVAAVATPGTYHAKALLPEVIASKKIFDGWWL